MTKDWNEFYRKRINSSYQDYFEKRYKPFLRAVIRQTTLDIVIDAGCGIGSVSKYLMKHGVPTFGYDLSEDMVELSRLNVPNGTFSVGDLVKSSTDNLVVTHGVLEHFDDDTIKTIIDNHPNSVHYVPLAGYKTPSFGDERLLPKEYWLDNYGAAEYGVFNNGLDLHFTIKTRK
tara:strand:+ start:44 stop:565 length:522 start_codon:yes stop_codon:yes gene_type:complete